MIHQKSEHIEGEKLRVLLTSRELIVVYNRFSDRVASLRHEPPSVRPLHEEV